MRFNILGTWTVSEGESKASKEQSIAGLTGVQALSRLNVCHILVVSPHDKRKLLRCSLWFRKLISVGLHQALQKLVVLSQQVALTGYSLLEGDRLCWGLGTQGKVGVGVETMTLSAEGEMLFFQFGLCEGLKCMFKLGTWYISKFIAKLFQQRPVTFAFKYQLTLSLHSSLTDKNEKTASIKAQLWQRERYRTRWRDWDKKDRVKVMEMKEGDQVHCKRWNLSKIKYIKSTEYMLLIVWQYISYQEVFNIKAFHSTGLLHPSYVAVDGCFILYVVAVCLFQW